jgi:predicted dehydrogenase
MTIKIGLFGCGGIAETHTAGYLKLGNAARITAVSDVVTANAQKLAERVGGAQVFSDFATLLAEADVDAVDVCLPHHLHRDAIVAAATAKKHILCEKPLCLTLEEAESIRRIIPESGVTLMCAHNQLFLPAVQRAKELLSQGILGKIYEIRTVDVFRHPWNMSGTTWRSNRATMGGGELIDTGYHPSYLLLYLAVSVPVEVTAMLSTYRIATLDGEDSAQVLVRFADGSVGNIVTSWAYDPPPHMGKFYVVGEHGTMHSDGTDLHYRIRGEEPVTIAGQSVNTFDREIADFIACLQEGRKAIQTEIDGINVLKVILGAYQSVAEKRIIVL